MQIRDATKDDSATLAYLINLAGEGIPDYLWSRMAQPGQSAQEVGRLRAERESGGFSYRNAKVCVSDGGEIAGMLLSYRQPDPYDLSDIEDVPDVVRPLVELEAKAPGSWYVNAIACYEHCRGQGVGTKLMCLAEELARAAGTAGLSLIVASENRGAKRLYDHLGYEVVASAPVIDYPGSLHGGDWLLMVKPLSESGNPR